MLSQAVAAAQVRRVRNGDQYLFAGILLMGSIYCALVGVESLWRGRLAAAAGLYVANWLLCSAAFFTLSPPRLGVETVRRVARWGVILANGFLALQLVLVSFGLLTPAGPHSLAAVWSTIGALALAAWPLKLKPEATP